VLALSYGGAKWSVEQKPVMMCELCRNEGCVFVVTLRQVDGESAHAAAVAERSRM